jgi:hypothetical protein
VREVLTTLLEVLGIVAVVAGVALMFWPAAFVVGGVGLIFVSRGLSR